jgi:carbamoyl-phosphate synthase large subunit
MMHLNSVLITGCAGDIGLGIARIIRDLPWIEKIYGCDINDQIPVSYFYDGFRKIPKVKDPNYLESIATMNNEFKFQLIIPSSEPELRFFSRNKITDINGVPLLIPSFEIMNLGFDKLRTSLYLKENGYPFPWVAEVSNSYPVEFPCIVKSRYGSGSKTINIVHKESLEYFKKNYPEYIFQELLLPNSEEYTCGVFRTKNGETRTIIFKRVLVGGRTGYAEVVKNAEIENLLLKIAEDIKFHGSINIQLRLTEKGPIIFEINPRFSSTVVFRHKLGFEDVKWAILDLFGEKDEMVVKEENLGKKIFRSDTEIIY